MFSISPEGPLQCLKLGATLIVLNQIADIFAVVREFPMIDLKPSSIDPAVL